MTFCPKCREFGFYNRTCPKCGGPMKEKERLSKPFRPYDVNLKDPHKGARNNIIRRDG